MEAIIRKFTMEDIPSIHQLILELAIFEKAPEKVSNTVEQMRAEMDAFDCLVAESRSGEIVGMALFYPVYYTWVGKSMYLDDLVVNEKWRGKGIGSALLNEVIAEAQRQKCKRLRWQVLDWNEKAIALYRQYGCTIDEEWMNCDMSFDLE
jgi:predicted N-acetyltransferase YhbS